MKELMAIISKTKDGNTVIAGGHIRYAGENGHDGTWSQLVKKEISKLSKERKTLKTVSGLNSI